jgi:hypothetical protein
MQEMLQIKGFLPPSGVPELASGSYIHYLAVENGAVVRAGLPPQPVLVLAEGIPVRVGRGKEVPENRPIRGYRETSQSGSTWKSSNQGAGYMLFSQKCPLVYQSIRAFLEISRSGPNYVEIG